MVDIPERLVHALRESRHTVILTGAGVSAESGVPTFRDAQNALWARYRPEELASPEAFQRDPVLVWQWYQWRRGLIKQARPNAAHLAIAAMERLLQRLTLITQNVDGLHQAAGSTAVIEFHGNIHRNRCSAENQLVDVDAEGTTRPPRCSRCEAWIRPDVVWFGEPIPQGALLTATLAAQDCDVFLSVGTSSVVYPAAGLADMAREAGATLAEVNPQRTVQTDSAAHVLQGKAAEIMPAMAAALG